LALAVAFWLDLLSGSAPITAGDALGIALGRLPADADLARILLDFRLPRVLTALAAGMALPVAGALMQALFRNPLASPSELGVSAGASMGVALLLLGVQGGGLGFLFHSVGASWGMAGAASLGAMAVMAVISALAARVRQSATLLIAGLLISQLIAAGIGLLQWASGAESLRAFTFWGLGSLAGVDPTRLRLLLPLTALGLTASMALAKPLDGLALGEEGALSLGIRLKPLRLVLLFVASLLTAVITAFCGPIAFIALMVPHLARGLMRRTSHLIVLPACMLIGGALLLLCDAATQMPGGGGVLPINALTALIGAPVILAVVLRREKPGRSAP